MIISKKLNYDYEKMDKAPSDILGIKSSTNLLNSHVHSLDQGKICKIIWTKKFHKLTTKNVLTFWKTQNHLLE